MTAALASYEDLVAFDERGIESTIETLGDEPIVSLLLLRFRSFLRTGHQVSEALLLAVGYAEPEARFILQSSRSGSPVYD